VPYSPRRLPGPGQRPGCDERPAASALAPSPDDARGAALTAWPAVAVKPTDWAPADQSAVSWRPAELAGSRRPGDPGATGSRKVAKLLPGWRGRARLLRTAARTTVRSAGRLMRRAMRLSDMSASSPEAEMRNCSWLGRSDGRRHHCRTRLRGSPPWESLVDPCWAHWPGCTGSPLRGLRCRCCAGRGRPLLPAAG
jgi:hypothetical protein